MPHPTQEKIPNNEFGKQPPGTLAIDNVADHPMKPALAMREPQRGQRAKLKACDGNCNCHGRLTEATEDHRPCGTSRWTPLGSAGRRWHGPPKARGSRTAADSSLELTANGQHARAAL